MFTIVSLVAKLINYELRHKAVCASAFTYIKIISPDTFWNEFRLVFSNVSYLKKKTNLHQFVIIRGLNVTVTSLSRWTECCVIRFSENTLALILITLITCQTFLFLFWNGGIKHGHESCSSPKWERVRGSAGLMVIPHAFSFFFRAWVSIHPQANAN